MAPAGSGDGGTTPADGEASAHPAPPVSARAVLVVAVLSVGVSAILIRYVEDAPAITIAFYRLFFTVLILAPIAFVRHRGEFAKLSRRDLVVALGIGVVLAVHFAAWIESLFHTSVASSVIVVSMEAILATIGASLFLGEHLPARQWALIGLSFLGVALIALGDAGPAGAFTGSSPLYGDTLAFIGAIAAAVYFVSGRRLRQRVHLIVYVGIVYWMCSLVLLAMVLARRAPLTGFSDRTWLLFLLMAIFPTIGGHTLFNWSLRHLRTATVSTAILGEPLVAIALAAALFGEIPGTLGLIGGALALLGILGVVRHHPAPAPAPSGLTGAA